MHNMNTGIWQRSRGWNATPTKYKIKLHDNTAALQKKVRKDKYVHSYNNILWDETHKKHGDTAIDA